MTDCVHHWHIEEAVAPTSEGFCLKCGATDTFKNGYNWDSRPQGGDALHYLFDGEKKDWAGEWVSDRQRENWAW